MNRTLAATAFAAAALFSASAMALPVTSTFAKTYVLQCAVNASDGAALKVRTMVKNTSGRVIKQGTKIQVTYLIGIRRIAKSETAYRDVMVNDSIGFDQPRGARSCRALVSLPRIDATRLVR
jgi:hypothetical protein